MPLEKSQIFHIVGEIVVIVGMFVYFQIKLSSTTAKVGQLERVILEQNKKIKILDTVLQEVVKAMPPQVRNEISHRVQMVSESSPSTGIPSPRAPSQTPKPQENPLSSVMSMIAPMMSSMMVAGMSGDDDQNDRVVVEEALSVSSDISDADIAEELQELDDEPQEIEEKEENEEDNEENDENDENEEIELGNPVSSDD